MTENAESNKKKGLSWQTVVSLISAAIAIASLGLNCINNSRAAKLFGSQVRPLIQARPVDIVERPEITGVFTRFDVVNYSGFDAHDVSIDIKYEGHDWVGQWRKAKVDHLKKKTPRTKEEDEQLHEYSQDYGSVGLVRAGEMAPPRLLGGALTLEEIHQKPQGFSVLVRTTWKNEKRHTFDRVRRYVLVPTSEGVGRSVTFIPDEIVAEE